MVSDGVGGYHGRAELGLLRGPTVLPDQKKGGEEGLPYRPL